MSRKIYSRAEGIEKRKQNQKAWYRRHPEEYHARYVQKMYGISGADYAKMLAEQNGVCKICQRTDQLGRRLAVDHDHKTGQVRGLLCGGCNWLVGHAENMPEAIWTYLKK